jgi:hypothetical protein
MLTQQWQGECPGVGFLLHETLARSMGSATIASGEHHNHEASFARDCHRSRLWPPRWLRVSLRSVMERSKTLPLLCFALVFALCLPKIATAQTITELQQTPIQRHCSEQADALGLHDEARKAFRSRCKEAAQGDTGGQVRKSSKASQGNNGVSIGMTAEQVRKSSWGKPKSINETITARGKHEQWVYGGGYLYLENGVLTSIQTSR